MKRLILAYVLGAIGLGIGAFSMIGYVVRVQQWYDWNQIFGTIAMAFPTAIAVTCVSSSALLLASVVTERKFSHAESPKRAASGFTRRESISSLACLGMAIVTVFACVETSADRQRSAMLDERERAIVDREAQLITIAGRYEAALLNQRRYFESARERWGALGSIVTAFVAPPKLTRIEHP